MLSKTQFGMKGKGRDSYLELVLSSLGPCSLANFQRKGRDSYRKLVWEFPLFSIKSDKHLDAAQKLMDRILAKGYLDTGEEMYLDALSDLVGAYEDEHHPIAAASDADMLRHLLEAKGITQAKLSRETSISKSTISEVLAGKKPFSRQMIRKLAGYFNVDVSILAANI